MGLDSNVRYTDENCHAIRHVHFEDLGTLEPLFVDVAIRSITPMWLFRNSTLGGG